MNDSLRTDIFLRYTPETISCACIDLAARVLQIPLPKNPIWYLIFGARPDEVHQIMFAILRLYRHRPKPLDELEKLISLIRDKRDDERKKSRFEPIQSTAVPSPQPTTNNTPSSTIVIETATTTTTNEVSATVTTTKESESVSTITNGKSDKDSSNKKTHRTRKYSRSRSSSRSPSRSQRKKKSSHRNRSRSPSNSSRREKYHKDKHYRTHSSHHRRKKDRKRRSSSPSSSSSVSPSNNRSSSYNQKHPLSTKDINHNLHSSKQRNGVSSNRKFKN